MRAIVRYPDAGGPLPGIVLVDGPGDSAADGWGPQPATFGDCGAVVLTHDKPGCGGSPGDWREQTIADRASDSLAALAVLRRHPGVDQDRVGFLGISQGGWVAYLAASLAPQDVAHLVAISGPAVSAAEQERYRIGCAVDGDEEALAWVDQRTRRLLPGEDPAAIIASQLEFADRPWYALACGDYVAELLPFFVGLPSLSAWPGSTRPWSCLRCAARCALPSAVPTPWYQYAAASTSSTTCYPATPGTPLPFSPVCRPRPAAPEYDRTIPYREQLAPGFLAMLTGWLVIR
jgi:uncharacterized protein